MTQDISSLELHYHQITALYDLADDLVDTIGQSKRQDPESQLRIVEPLIEQVSESADILCEEFIEVAGKQSKTPVRKNKIESALRKIYIALDNYTKATIEFAVDTTTNLRNVADPVVEKIKRQVEHIISIMVDFIDISLDRIMQKQHIEELKKRQEKIANMIYLAEQRKSGLGFAVQ
jgi:uncharacterized alkaline shock family protein YloU